MMERAFKIGGHCVILLSWLAFLLSFFLPATNVLGIAGTPPGTPLNGWQAFTGSLSAGALNFWAWVADIRVLLYLVFPFTNAIMLSAPTFAWLRQGAFVPALILVPAASIPWFLPHHLTGDLYVGFYVWNASYVVASIGGCAVAIAHLDNGNADC